jgi:dsRNA-specific ribonuclease
MAKILKWNLRFNMRSRLKKEIQMAMSSDNIYDQAFYCRSTSFQRKTQITI